MAWMDPVKQRAELIADVTERGLSVAEASRRRGVSRKTAYKWLGRFRDEGGEGLVDRSRAPHHRPNATSPEVVEALLDMKERYPSWGPDTIVSYLERNASEQKWPAVSTVSDLFSRHGLVKHRRRRPHLHPDTSPFSHVKQPNDTWCMDFKGWWRTGDGHRCDPLTITDADTRYLLRSQLVPRTTYQHVRAVVEATFREFGLPTAIRTDNGSPFATLTYQGLSRLSLWWLKLGIRHERIGPGQPQQNGRHERMHLTLKRAVPIKETLRQQQRALERFRREYNEERPHQALGNQPPSAVYRSSPRPLPSREPELVYAPDLRLIKVRPNGGISWKDKDLFLSEVLVGEYIAVVQIDERYQQIFVGPLAWARIDMQKNQLVGNAKSEVRRETKKLSPMSPE